MTFGFQPNGYEFMPLDVSRLSPVLFWDVDPATVRWDEHRRWLLQRVLERGTWEDWPVISDAVSSEELSKLGPSLDLQDRERNFLRLWIRRRHAR
jgi:hypothetical protein